MCISERGVGFSQREFARRLGGSESAMQLIENGRRKITRALALKVSAFTGCDPDALMRGQALDLGGREYNQLSFQYWSGQMPVSQEDAKKVARHFAQVSAFIIEAAANDSSGGGGGQHRFREVTTLLSQAIDEILSRFNMTDSLLHLMASEAPAGEWDAIKLDVARAQFGALKKWIGIDDPNRVGSEGIEVRTTFYPQWSSYFGNSLYGEPANFAMPLLRSRKKIEIRVPWQKGVCVLWFNELTTPCGKVYETRPEDAQQSSS